MEAVKNKNLTVQMREPVPDCVCKSCFEGEISKKQQLNNGLKICYVIFFLINYKNMFKHLLDHEKHCIICWCKCKCSFQPLMSAKQSNPNNPTHLWKIWISHMLFNNKNCIKVWFIALHSGTVCTEGISIIQQHNDVMRNVCVCKICIITSCGLLSVLIQLMHSGPSRSHSLGRN